LFFSIWKLCCFVIWLGVSTNLCYWLRLFCTLVDHSGTISLVWTTRGFYPWFEGFSTLKILVPLFVLLVIYYCCSLIIAPHRFLQVRENYIRCILWYIICCCFPHQPYHMSGCVLIMYITFLWWNLENVVWQMHTHLIQHSCRQYFSMHIILMSMLMIWDVTSWMKVKHLILIYLEWMNWLYIHKIVWMRYEWIVKIYWIPC